MPARILYCHCAFAHVLPDANRRAAMEALLAAGAEVEWVSDLCALAAAGDGRLAAWTAGPDPVVCACHPRAVRALLDAAGMGGEHVRHVDLRAGDPDAIRAELAGLVGSAVDGDAANLAWRREEVELRLQDLPPDAWHPWFPAIDRERCVDCGQCHEFCIFGAFDRDPDGRVTVAEPAKCKINCPACARVCPRAAIIFPKYAAGGPIAGGEGPAAEPVQVDIQHLLAGDPYEVLRARQRVGGGCSRFGSQAGDVDAVAAACPCELGGDLLEQLGVPDSVLADNADEIRQRLEAMTGRDGDA